MQCVSAAYSMRTFFPAMVALVASMPPGRRGIAGVETPAIYEPFVARRPGPAGSPVPRPCPCYKAIHAASCRTADSSCPAIGGPRLPLRPSRMQITAGWRYSPGILSPATAAPMIWPNRSPETRGVAPTCVATHAANRFAASLISSSGRP